ncbi:hypothetical protein BDZ94DRAFT_1262790 [Collybia nuda]|uniref:Transmembrane protein n=1 Tax=Collybia nuda TaxID=64659 RepID=A0A9P5Y376_9AGAR|nr:hypothetical protein BDZ94DRAFT_1262790 [Collybia nuda]
MGEARRTWGFMGFTRHHHHLLLGYCHIRIFTFGENPSSSSFCGGVWSLDEQRDLSLLAEFLLFLGYGYVDPLFFSFFIFLSFFLFLFLVGALGRAMGSGPQGGSVIVIPIPIVVVVVVNLEDEVVSPKIYDRLGIFPFFPFFLSFCLFAFQRCGHAAV